MHVSFYRSVLSIYLYLYIYSYLSIRRFIHVSTDLFAFLSLELFSYIPFYLFIYLSIDQPTFPPSHPSIYLSIYLPYLCIYRSIYASACVFFASVCLSVFCLFIDQSIDRPLYRSICLPSHLSIYLHTYMSMYTLYLYVFHVYTTNSGERLVGFLYVFVGFTR